MRIAFFNWRDIRHPMAGGAEVYVHELLKRLRGKGHDTTLFTSSFPGSADREVIDGVEHVRYGGRFSIYAKSFLCYRKHIRGKYDVIVESINGVPFFTPLFAKEKVVSLIHQLTRENWYSALPYPLAFAGFHSEDSLLRLYGGNMAIVPSPSTKSDLEKLGFRDIHIVYGAAGISPPPDAKKEKRPTLIYLGRLTKSKRVEHVLRAFVGIRGSVKDAHLWVAGSGPQEKSIRQLAKSLGLDEHVDFLGKVAESEKAGLLSRAHLMVLPAVREGWGLVVLEANACGTPVLGYDIPGLRDSIAPGINGFVVQDGDIPALSARASSLLKDAQLLERLSASSSLYSRKFSWDASADRLESLLESACRR